jgi:signal transduction histidine kinase
VGNAIKFTDTGGITVTVGISPHLPPEVEVPSTHGASHPWAWVSVVDTGIGIPEAEQGDVFEWFRQGNQARSGHGLGLHLSQRIAQMHGGIIAVTSEMGQGSCFTLYLPTSE